MGIHVAGWQRHFLQIGRLQQDNEQRGEWRCATGDAAYIPSRHDNAPVRGVGPDGADHLRKLVDSLSRVVSVHAAVCSTKMAPLETVNWAKVVFFSIVQTDRIQI